MGGDPDLVINPVLFATLILTENSDPYPDFPFTPSIVCSREAFCTFRIQRCNIEDSRGGVEQGDHIDTHMSSWRECESQEVDVLLNRSTGSLVPSNTYLSSLGLCPGPCFPPLTADEVAFPPIPTL